MTVDIAVQIYWTPDLQNYLDDGACKSTYELERVSHWLNEEWETIIKVLPVIYATKDI